jgi:hypothetical protein
MLHLLKRHPFPVKAFFRRSLVLTYAFPSDLLEPLLPPGVALDAHGQYGFLAIALVQTERLRPSFLPAALGCDFILSGYRVFVRLGKRASSVRGLFILRSDTNRRWMAAAGNIFTHYKYRLCEAELNARIGAIEWNIRTPSAEADLRVIARVDEEEAALPAGSPFLTVKEARRFAGPLPYTFDYERETHSLIRIQGVRQQWRPKAVAVEVLQNTFLRQEPFCRATATLANAFCVDGVPYLWNRGICSRLEAT